MYALVHCRYEALTVEDEVRLFTTHDAAWEVMTGEFVEANRRNGDEPLLPVEGGDVLDSHDRGTVLGYVDDDFAYMQRGEDRWAIFHVGEPLR